MPVQHSTYSTMQLTLVTFSVISTLTSVPPDVNIMSDALPPTILATVSLEW